MSTTPSNQPSPPPPPSPSPFPTSLSDLRLADTTTTPTLYATLKALKKTTLSLHNRLTSILTDAIYIQNTIHPQFPSFPLLANERCGSWYIPPRLKSGSAYFKSTDGHYGHWDFSLRRLNLQVLEVLGRWGGAVLVDSTRRGKRMPDALRRTVPVWVVVWNRVLFPEVEWAGRLQHPGLEEGEVRLVEARVQGWVDGLVGLGLDLNGLRDRVKRPIRCRWVVHGEDEVAGQGGVNEVEDGDANLLVLCSASRRVLGAEMSEDGYIQGAGDDAEGWSGGLTPVVFWEHKDELLSMPEEELPDLVSALVQKEKTKVNSLDAVQVKPTEMLFIASGNSLTDDDMFEAQFDLVVDCNSKAATESAKRVNLGCRSGKLGSRDLRERLVLVRERATECFNKNAGTRVLVMCENGRDLSVGVAVMLLCLLYDDSGQLTLTVPVVVDKTLVKKRLAWITTQKPDANPSRATLQAVNSFLMGQPP